MGNNAGLRPLSEVMKSLPEMMVWFFDAHAPVRLFPDFEYRYQYITLPQETPQS